MRPDRYYAAVTTPWIRSMKSGSLQRVLRATATSAAISDPGYMRIPEPRLFLIVTVDLNPQKCL